MANRRLFRMIIPRFPSVNIYTRIANKTTALGPVVVATAVNRMPGWDVEIIDENNYHAPGPRGADGLPDHAALQAERPADAVGFYGGLSSTVLRLYTVARFYRGCGVFTIGGGQHLDALPDEAMAQGLDAVVHGEGEDVIVDLLAAWQDGGVWQDVSGVSAVQHGHRTTRPARPLREDFSSLPLPDFGLLRHARIGIYPVSRIRGCGMACEFCTVRGRPRCASPELLMRHISHLVERRRAREFFVVDDHFAQDRDQTLDFCHLLAAYQQRTGISLFLTVQIRLDCGSDSELLEAMHAANIRVVAIGIESPIDAELRAMNKHLDSARMVDLMRRFHRAGFMVHGMFIFAYPQRIDTGFRMGWRERVTAFRRFIRTTRVDTIQILLPVPLPGTPFRERMAAAGRLVADPGVGWQHHDGTYPLVVPDAPLTITDIHRAQTELMSSFYRFRAIIGVVLQTLGFPLLVLPVWGWHGRWRAWYRTWRNRVIACAGSLIMSRWRRAFRDSVFPAILRQRDCLTR